MSTESPPMYDEILATVSTWSESQRRALARDILDTLAPETAKSLRRRVALQRLDGVLAAVKPTPTDEDIQRWLDERRQEKYG
jgi:hypothetical protein